MEYKYEALDAQGNEVEDTIKAYDHKSAIKAIRDKGLFPTKVNVIGNGVEPKKKSRTIPDWLIFRTTKEKAMFSIICVLIILIAGLAKEIMMTG
jgi:type II secretory pathway component PulF